MGPDCGIMGSILKSTMGEYPLSSKRIKAKTCALMGLIGSVAGVVAGALMAAGLSEAGYARTAAFVLYGAMILFLAAFERGDGLRGLRTKLFLLFLALLVSWFDLPLLCPVLEALVLPLFSLLYRSPDMRPRFFVLLAAEALYLVIRTIAILPVFAPYTLQVVGAAIIVVSVARFAMLAFLRVQFVNEEAG